MCQSARWWWRDLNISLAFSRKGPCAATHALVILESIPWCTSGAGSKQNMNFVWWALPRCPWERTHRNVILLAAKLHQSAVSKTGTLDWSHYYYLRCRKRVVQHFWCMEHTAPSISCKCAMCLYKRWYIYINNGNYRQQQHVQQCMVCIQSTAASTAAHCMFAMIYSILQTIFHCLPSMGRCLLWEGRVTVPLPGWTQ